MWHGSARAEALRCGEHSGMGKRCDERYSIFALQGEQKEILPIPLIVVSSHGMCYLWSLLMVRAVLEIVLLNEMVMKTWSPVSVNE